MFPSQKSFTTPIYRPPSQKTGKNLMDTPPDFQTMRNFARGEYFYYLNNIPV